jgi:hypothetical protein
MTHAGKTEILREKFLPVHLVPPHGMTWDQARTQTMNTVGAGTYSAGELYVHTFIYLCNAVLYITYYIYILCMH